MIPICVILFTEVVYSILNLYRVGRRDKMQDKVRRVGTSSGLFLGDLSRFRGKWFFRDPLCLFTCPRFFGPLDLCHRSPAFLFYKSRL